MGRVPASMARSVDLPALLGPMRPVSVPRRTERETPATARTPPNSRTTSLACSATSPAPGDRATAASAAAPGAGAAGRGAADTACDSAGGAAPGALASAGLAASGLAPLVPPAGGAY